MVTYRQGCDPRSALHDLAAPLVTEDNRKRAFRIFARQCKCVGVTDPAGMHFQQDFTLSRPFDLDFFNLQGLLWFPRDRGSGFHGYSLRFCRIIYRSQTNSIRQTSQAVASTWGRG